MPTIMVIFVQSTFVLATCVQIRNISAVINPILTNTLDPILGPKKIWKQEIFWTNTFFNQKFSGRNISGDQKTFWTENFVYKNFVWAKYLTKKTILMGFDTNEINLLVHEYYYCVSSNSSVDESDHFSILG